jgi:AraC-like DNA-binding protein
MYSCRQRALAALGKLPAVALLTDVAPDRELPADAFVRLVHQRFPKLPVVAVVHLTSVDVRALLRIAPIGVEEVIAIGIDSPWQVVQSVLTSPAVDASIEMVLSTLRPRIRDDAWPFVTSVVRGASTPISVNDWSARLGVQRTTLLRRLRAVGLPPPTMMLTLGRLLVAAQLLGVHNWTVKHTAAALQYSSAATLRKSLRHHAGVRPHQTRTSSGLDRVMNAVGAILQISYGAERLA